MAVIEAHELTKRFGRVAAADRVSFAVEAGTVTGFLGPNGAGKTTTLRMLLGLARPDRGGASICGQPYHELDHPLRRVGVVLDAASAHPGRSARAHLRIQAMAAQMPRSRVEEVIDLVGLSAAAGRRAGQFSLGMRQRLGLAAALLPRPEVLILDEPANGLDPEGVHWLRDLLRRQADEGRAVLVSSHILAEVAQTVDHVVILNRGRLVADCPLAELTAGSASVVRIRTPRAADLAAALVAEGADAQIVAPDRLAVTGTGPEQVAIVAASHAIPLVESVTGSGGLEEAFLRLTSPAGDAEVPR